MASLMELVDRVNKGELLDPVQLEIYQDSPNSAEKFLAHHAHAMLDLRKAHQHMLQSLEAIEYSDQKVLSQFLSISQFLGLTDLRTQPVIKFGSCAINRREYALGLEAIQNGIAFDLQFGGAYTSDRENCQFIANQYERVASAIGWTRQQPIEWNNKQTRIAYIVSSLADEDGAIRALRSFARAHDAKRFKLAVYSTEAQVRREKTQFAAATFVAPSVKRSRETLDYMNEQKISTWLAPAEGDLIHSAKELASQLVKDKVDVVIFDTTQADPVAALIANWEIARVKINFSRKAPLYARAIDCVTYFDQGRYESDKDYWQKRETESRFVLEGIDTEADLGPLAQRSAYGIPEQAIVLATAGQNLDRSLTEEFVETIVNILRSHPHAIYLLVGEGDLAWQKRKFESAGVGRRVGYAGKRKDLPAFLRIADLYLAEFPVASATGVLQAMSVERAVVAMRWGDEVDQSQAAAFVGSEGTIIGRDTNAYVERVSRIIREAPYRQKLGKLMRNRVEQHFAFTQTARHIEQMIDQLIQSRSEHSVIDNADIEPQRIEKAA